MRYDQAGCVVHPSLRMHPTSGVSRSPPANPCVLPERRPPGALCSFSSDMFALIPQWLGCMLGPVCASGTLHGLIFKVPALLVGCCMGCGSTMQETACKPT